MMVFSMPSGLNGTTAKGEQKDNGEYSEIAFDGVYGIVFGYGREPGCTTGVHGESLVCIIGHKEKGIWEVLLCEITGPVKATKWDRLLLERRTSEDHWMVTLYDFSDVRKGEKPQVKEQIELPRKTGDIPFGADPEMFGLVSDECGYHPPDVKCTPEQGGETVVFGMVSDECGYHPMLSKCTGEDGDAGLQSDLKTWAKDLTKEIAAIRGDIGRARVQREQWFESLRRADKLSGSAPD